MGNPLNAAETEKRFLKKVEKRFDFFFRMYIVLPKLSEVIDSLNRVDWQCLCLSAQKQNPFFGVSIMKLSKLIALSGLLVLFSFDQRQIVEGSGGCMKKR